jgi:hypothetical protein
MTFPPAKTWKRTLLTAVLSVGLAGPTTWAADAPPDKSKAMDEKPMDAKPGDAKPATPKPPTPAKAPATGKAAGTTAAAENADPIDAAVRRAVNHLYSTQKNDNWETVSVPEDDGAAKVTGAQWGGLTAMATYALLAAGESPQDPRVAKAIAWLNKAQISGTYAMGMKLQIWNYIERLTPQQKDVLKKDATLLLGAVKTGGGKAGNLGLYHYWLDPTKGDYDHSTSNYGVLGMWAAAQQNLEVPTKFWEIVDDAWRKNQNANGGWSYYKTPQDNHPVNMSMTGAGVATLFITQDMLSEGRGGECKGSVDDKNLAAGLKWLSDNYSKSLAEGLNLYAMYNIERVGTASGYKYFGTVDWYKDGAARLLKAQQKDGSWPGGYGGVASTTWAILFLTKGRAPVMMNKLEYALGEKATTPANWNQRPRDVANLARWAGKQLEKELNWQIVNLKVGVEDLHDSPILYIAGNQNLNFSKDDRAKLRQYVEQGGLILGHADCNSPAFTSSFMKLGQELFENRYEWRDLPRDHLIYSAHFSGKQWPQIPTVRGLSNGARELMLVIPANDPARYWQIKNFTSKQTEPLAELATNIYLYALDKSELQGRYKGQTWLVRRNDKVPTAATVKVARLDYGGNWDPEPAGWRRLANLLHNERGVDLTVEPVKLGDGKLKANKSADKSKPGGGYKVAHLTGTHRLKLNDKQRQELKQFVADGGTLLVDAAGGSAGDFKESVEAELQLTFDNAAKALGAPLPANHAVYTVGGDKLDRVTYRPFAKRLLANGMNTPRLRGIDVAGGRTGVFYSPEDLSVGLVGMSIDGIYGYDPEDATDLVANIVLLANGGAPPKVAATKPAAEPAKPTATGEKGDKKDKPADTKKPKSEERPKTAKK